MDTFKSYLNPVLHSHLFKIKKLGKSMYRRDPYSILHQGHMQKVKAKILILN